MVTSMTPVPAPDFDASPKTGRKPVVDRRYQCRCLRPVFFRNSVCLACCAPLGYEPHLAQICPLDPLDDGTWGAFRMAAPEDVPPLRQPADPGRLQLARRLHRPRAILRVLPSQSHHSRPDHSGKCRQLEQDRNRETATGVLADRSPPPRSAASPSTFCVRSPAARPSSPATTAASSPSTSRKLMTPSANGTASISTNRIAPCSGALAARIRTLLLGSSDRRHLALPGLPRSLWRRNPGLQCIPPAPL